VSIRRACSVLEFDRSTYHYKSRRREQAGLEARINEICATRVRYGYRRVHVLLRREGWEINLKKTHRIYNELGLQLRNKTPKRRVKASRPDMPLEIGPMNRQERRFHLMIEQSRPLTRTHRAIASALERPATRKA
jgi:putative transposase